LWNRVASRIEMHLESAHDQRVRIAPAGLDLRFTASETIHTENSDKFTHEAIRTLLEDAGFAVEQSWTDPREWYVVTLARIPSSSEQRASKKIRTQHVHVPGRCRPGRPIHSIHRGCLPLT